MLETRRAPLRGPLTLYVAWHPSCADGSAMAKGIYDWFRAPSQSVRRSGAGIPVYYRGAGWRETPAIPSPARPLSDSLKDLEPIQPIAYDAAEINVVVALVDEHMVIDRDWRDWLYDQAARHRASRGPEAPEGGRVILIPVQLHDSLSRLHESVSGLNAIRVDHWNDSPEETDDERRERRRRRVCRYLVQALVRRLRESRDSRSDLLPRSIFLSHAKGDLEDGVGVAERIRARALRHGQIDTFFDAAQLHWAERWEDPMRAGAEFKTAAFIAVFSDLYSSRYWCREEIQGARRPMEIDRHGKRRRRRSANPGDQVWWVQPTVIVDTLSSSWSHLLPEMSGTPILRWRGSDAAAAEVLDRIMLEALRSELQARHAFLLLSFLQKNKLHGQLTGLHREAGAKTPPLHFLTWLPDAHTLMEWAFPRPSRGARPAKRRIAKALVVYPGHGLDQREAERFAHYLGEKVCFTSYEELATLLRHRDFSVAAGESAEDERADGERRQAPIAERPLVALAVEDPPAAELHALGYGSEHLDDAVFRLSTSLVAAGSRLAYAGPLRGDSRFLDELSDAATLLGGARPSKTPEPETLLHSYQAVGISEESRGGAAAQETAEHRARSYGVCAFHDSLPPADVDGRRDFENERIRRAEALSAMRTSIARDSSALLALGGRRVGFEGFAPPVLEQICRSFEAGKPVYVLSAFGGASRAFVSWLLGEQPSCELLDYDFHAAHPGNGPLIELREALERELAGEYGRGGAPEAAERLLRERLGELHRIALDFRTGLRRDLEGPRRRLSSGLYPEETWQILTSGSVSRLRYLLAERAARRLR
ncbi:MAG: TIR domain-containing protein [Acidobacteriota bacterium]